MRVALSLIFVFIASVSFAEPVYLECYNKQGKKEYLIMLDESALIVNETYVGSESEKGRTRQGRATFTADSVTYRAVYAKFGESEVVHECEINRNTLHYKICAKVVDKNGDELMSEGGGEGVCKIVDISGNKF